jgi:hypothetical protein
MFAALNKYVQVTHFTCHEKVEVAVGEMVLRTAWEVLKRQVSKTCSALAALNGMSMRRQRTREMKNRKEQSA